MTFEELKDEISKLENPLSEDWWPQVATLMKVFADGTDDAGREQARELLNSFVERAEHGNK